MIQQVFDRMDPFQQVNSHPAFFSTPQMEELKAKERLKMEQHTQWLQQGNKTIIMQHLRVPQRDSSSGISTPSSCTQGFSMPGSVPMNSPDTSPYTNRKTETPRACASPSMLQRRHVPFTQKELESAFRKKELEMQFSNFNFNLSR